MMQEKLQREVSLMISITGTLPDLGRLISIAQSDSAITRIFFTDSDLRRYRP